MSRGLTSVSGSTKLSRQLGRRTPAPSVLLVCEGDRTERDYFAGLKSVERLSAVKLRFVVGQTNPLSLVERAKTERDRVGSEFYEQIWCIFDTEDPVPHPHLKPAIDLAKSEGFLVARSNPCFEIWLILHFQEQNKSVSTYHACKIANGLPGIYGKRVRYEDLSAGLDTAVGRARELEIRHTRNGNQAPNDNPSTGVGELVGILTGRRPQR